MTGTTAGITHLPLPTDDPTRRQPDITRAREQLQWSPSVTLRDGLLPTIEYFRAAVAD
jgi:UDP-glucuronate decarboxylase